jgi:protein-disulfide isomerase
MLSMRLGAAAAAIVLLLSSLQAGAADTPAAAEQSRIDQAVKAYAGKLRADQEKARDQAVANKASALLDDPMTQVIGNPKGDVAVIEFFDYTCPYCKAVEPRLRALLDADSNVKLIVKEFPILRPESLVASKAALASVRQGKYTAYHQAMMAFKGRLDAAMIFEIAKDTGLDVERLKKDMDAPEIAGEIIANFNLARSLRIVDTPTFIVDGHILTEPSGTIDFPKTVAAARAK